MKRRVMGEEIEWAEIKSIREPDGKYIYKECDPLLVESIFTKVIAHWFKLQELKVDFFLPNGGQIRHETSGGHIEISTPECLDLHDIVAHDKAMELWALRVMQETETILKETIIFHKKNSDSTAVLFVPSPSVAPFLLFSRGASRGCHENYCVEPFFAQKIHAIKNKTISMSGEYLSFSPTMMKEISPDILHLWLFLVTRQILTGSGGIQFFERSGAKEAFYCISPRAFHTNLNFGSGTQSPQARGVIEYSRVSEHDALADSAKFRRLHIICGDANMAESSIFLKFGATAAVLEMIEQDFWDRSLVADHYNWEADLFQKLSCDLTCVNVPIRLQNGNVHNAIGIQRLFQKRFHEYLKTDSFPPEYFELDERWQEAIDCLERDDKKVYRLLDWKIKQRLIERYAERKSLNFGHSKITGLDLEYHNPDPAKGIYNILKNSGAVERIIRDNKITRAYENPPPNTRAALRAHILNLAKAMGINYTAVWSRINLKVRQSQYPCGDIDINLSDPFANSVECLTSLEEKENLKLLEKLRRKTRAAKRALES